MIVQEIKNQNPVNKIFQDLDLGKFEVCLFPVAFETEEYPLWSLGHIILKFRMHKDLPWHFFFAYHCKCTFAKQIKDANISKNN